MELVFGTNVKGNCMIEIVKKPHLDEGIGKPSLTGCLGKPQCSCAEDS